MNQEAANALAALLGGSAWNSGGDVYLVTLTRADGNVVVISDEVIALYPTLKSVGNESTEINHIDLV